MLLPLMSHDLVAPANKHKYTWFLSLDGNFRLTQLIKHCDPNDVPLNKGNAYFVNEKAFDDFLSEHDDVSTHVSQDGSLLEDILI